MKNDPYAEFSVIESDDPYAGFSNPVPAAVQSAPVDPYAEFSTPSPTSTLPFTNLTAEAYAGRPVPGTLLGDLNADGQLNLGEGILAVGRQFAYGVKDDLPRMLGDAMKYVSEPGGYFYEQGKSITDWVDQQERDNPDLTFKYEWDKNPVMSVLGGGARMIPMSLGPPLLLAGAVAFLPEEAVAALGGATAVGIATAIAGALPTGLSQGQQTYDKLIAAGVDDETARASSRLSGLIEWGGESVENMLGVAKWGFKTLGVGGKAAKIAGKDAVEYLAKLAEPKTWATVAGKSLADLARTMAWETGTEVGQQVGETAVENRAIAGVGGETTSLIDAATSVIGPTIGMTLLMAPLGIHASRMDARRQNAMKRAIEDPTIPEQFRAGAALALTKDLYEIDAKAAENFAGNASMSITLGLHMPLDESAVLDSTQFSKLAFEEYNKRLAKVPVSARIESFVKEAAKTTAPAPKEPVVAPVVEPVTPAKTPRERINDALGIKAEEGAGNVLQGQFYTPVMPVERIKEIKTQAEALGWTWDSENVSPDGTGTIRIKPPATMLAVETPIKPAIPENPTANGWQSTPIPTLKAPPNPAVAMYQAAPLATMGQQQGKQVAIYALDEHYFKTMIQPQTATTAMTLDSYKAQFPDHTHVALEKIPGQDWSLAGVGPLAELTKTPLAHPKVFMPVTDFNSTTAIAHSLRPLQKVQLPMAPGIRFYGTQAQALEKITGKSPNETPAVFTDINGTYLVHPKVERKEGVAIGRVQTPGPNKTMTERLFAWDTNKWYQLPTIRDRKVNPAEMVAAAKTFAITHPLAVTKPSIEAKLEGERADTFLNSGKENDNMPVGMHDPTKVMNTKITEADKQSPQGTLVVNNQNALPKFQGNKREMSMPVAKAVMDPDSGWTQAERDRITEGYEPFGGGGSWMLFQAKTMFHNLKKITMGELNQVRLDMIAYMHHNGNQFYTDLTKKDEQGRSARDILEVEWKRPQIIASGGGLVGRLQKVIDAKTYDKQAINEDQLKLLQIVTDLMPRSRKAIDGAIADVREQVTGLYNMAQDYIKNGGQIAYVQGDAYARDVPKGDHVLTTLDPPYVFTTGYGEQMVGVETYQKTLDLIDKAIKAGNNVIYTDSAWWRTHNDKISKADKDKALDILGAIQDRFDRFQSVAQQIGGHRYEVLGLHNPMRANRTTIEQKPVAKQRKVITREEFNAKAEEVRATLPFKVNQNIMFQKSIGGKKFKGIVKDIVVNPDLTMLVHIVEKNGKERFVIPEMVSMTSGNKAGLVATKRAVERKTLSPTEKIQVKNDASSFTELIRMTAPEYYDVNTETEQGTHAAVKDAWHSIAVEIDNADVTMQQADLDSNITKAELLPRLLAWAQANKDRLDYLPDMLPKPTYRQGQEIRMSLDPRQQQFNLTPPTPTIQETPIGGGLRPTETPEAGAGSSFITKLIDDGLTRARVIANKYSIPNIDEEEKFAVARAALIKAANAWDSSTGSDFITYSNVAIRNALRDSFNEQMTDQSALTSLQQPIGKQEQTGESVDATLANIIPNWSELTPDQQAAHRDVFQTVQDVVAALKPNDRIIIDSVRDDRPQVDVARELGVNPAAISQRKTRLFRDLRATLEAKGINPAMINDLFARPEASDEIRMSKANLPDKLGFYSQVERTVDGIQQNKMPGSQWLAWLEKQPGVKKEELDTLGIREWLVGQGTVTKDAMLEFIRTNNLQIQEVVKDYGPHFKTVEDAKTYLRDMLHENPDERYGYSDQQEYLTLANNMFGEAGKGKTKFAAYQTPGGENYREVLLTLPTQNDKAKLQYDARKTYGKNFFELTDAERIIIEKMSGVKQENLQQDYTSPHWSEPNVLAHVRMNDRTDTEGKKVLFIEEIQSDWHQTGREKGYDVNLSKVPLTEGIKIPGGTIVKIIPFKNTKELHYEVKFDQTGEVLPYSENEIRTKQYLNIASTLIPDAPFKTSWPMLAMKRMIRYAAENGYDRIAWTTGAMQAERYDLSKQLRDLHYVRDGESYRLFAHLANGELHNFGIHKANELSNVVGKELAAKIIRGEGDPSTGSKEGKMFSGLDLKVGGEGMKGFYDQILPNEVNKYVKKWGGRVGQTEVLRENNIFKKVQQALITTAQPEAAERLRIAQLNISVPSLDITPSMRENVMQGQPLFSKAPDARGVTAAQANSRIVNWINKQANLPEITVIQSIEDAAKLGLSDATMTMLRNERPRGFYFNREKRIIVIADGLATPEQALDVVLHEAVGHFGIEQVLGANFTQSMLALSRAEISEADMQRKTRDYYTSLPDQGLDKPLSSDRNRVYVAAEIIAERAQTNPTLWAKFVELVRRALLKMFPGTYVNKWIKEPSNIEALIQASRDFVQSGGGPQATPQMQSMLYGIMMSKPGLHAGQVLGTINDEGQINSTIAGSGDTHDTVKIPHTFMEKRWRYDPRENGVFSWSNLSDIQEADLRAHIKDRYGTEPLWIRTPNNPGAGRDIRMSKGPVNYAVPVLDQPTRDRYIQAMQSYKPDFIPRSWMVARAQPKIDEIGVMNALIKANVDGFPDSDEGTVYAQLLLNTPEFASLFKGDKGQQEMAISLTARSLEQGTKAGRALAYRRDLLQKPIDRQAAILKLISSPPEEIFKRWTAMTDAQRAVAIAEHRANMESAIAALKKLGINDFTNIDLALLTDTQKFMEVINKISEQMATTGDKIYEYWRNSILSGLQTNVVNMVSNFASATWDMLVQRPAEALVNMFVKDPNAPTFASVAAAYKMLWPHITAANNALRNSWTTETGMFTAADMSGNTAIAGTKGRVIRAPQRMLLAMDEWYKTILTTSLAYDYATRIADKDSMVGQDRENFIEWAANEQNGDSSAWEDAHNEAVRLLFQEKTGSIGTSILSARNAKGITGWVMKFIVPFVTTPANLIKIGIEKSPLGLIRMGMEGIAGLHNTEARYNGPNGKAMLIRDSVEQAIAWAMTGLLYTMTAPGGDGDDDWPKITGSISGSPAEKRFQQLNVPPQSIRIGGRWYSYARLEPFSTALTLMVDALNSFRKVKNGQGLGKEDAAKVLSLIRDKTYLQGVGDIIQGLEDPEKWVQMASNFGSSWTPNLLKQAIRATDPLQRDNRVRERGFAWLGQSLGIRGAQKALPLAELQPMPKFDHWGRPISKDVGMQLIGQPLSDIAWRMLVPMRVQNVKDENQIDRMIWNYNRTHEDGQWWPGNVRPTVTFRGTEYPMTDQQYERYQTTRGQIAMQMVNRINSWNFDNPTQHDIKVIEAVFERAGQRARKSMTREIIMQQLRLKTTQNSTD